MLWPPDDKKFNYLLWYSYDKLWVIISNHRWHFYPYYPKKDTSLYVNIKLQTQRNLWLWFCFFLLKQGRRHKNKMIRIRDDFHWCCMFQKWQVFHTDMLHNALEGENLCMCQYGMNLKISNFHNCAVVLCWWETLHPFDKPKLYTYIFSY